MEGEETGFMASLIPDTKDPRLMDILGTYIEDLNPEKYPGKEDWKSKLREKGGIPGIRSDMDDYIKRAARRFREAHDKGHFLEFPTPGNVTEHERQFYLKDFDSWKNIRGASPDQQIGYRFYDIFQFFNHLKDSDAFGGEISDNQLLLVFGVRPVMAFLEGYFYDRLNDSRVLGIQDMDEILKLGEQILRGKTLAHQIKHPLVGLVSDVVYGRKPPGKNIPTGFPVYAYPVEGSALQTTFQELSRTLQAAMSGILLDAGIWKVNLVELRGGAAEQYYNPARNEWSVIFPEGTKPDEAKRIFQRALDEILRTIGNAKLLQTLNGASEAELKILIGPLTAKRGGDSKRDKIVRDILSARPFQGLDSIRDAIKDREIVEGLRAAILASSLGETAKLYFEKRGYGTPNPLTAEIVTRDVAGNVIDRFVLETAPEVFEYLFAQLFEVRNAAPVEPSVGAFNLDLAPALRFLGIQLNEKGGPLILDQGVTGNTLDEKQAGRLIQVAGRGGAVILLGENASLRRYLDQYAAAGEVLVKYFPVETVNSGTLNQVLKGYDLPALALSTRDEPLVLEFKGEKIKLDKKLLDQHGIDPLQALALFKQIVDNPAEKRKELFSKAGLDFDQAAGHWTVTERFIESFLKSAYSAQEASRILAQAA